VIQEVPLQQLGQKVLRPSSTLSRAVKPLDSVPQRSSVNHIADRLGREEAQFDRHDTGLGNDLHGL